MSRLEQLRKLAELEPNDPMSHYGVGLECINLAEWHEATVAFAKALAVDETYSAAYYHKARAEIAAGRGDDARHTLEAGIACAVAAADRHTESEMRELLVSLA